MKYVKKYGCYKVWYFPRKGMYRISRESDPRLYISLDHTRDFKSLDEIESKLAPQSDFHYTDPYNVAIQWLRQEENKENENYEEINLLAGQYYYGVKAKKELRDKLVSIGVL